MDIKTRLKQVALVIAVLFAFYCLIYVETRWKHYLVHRISCNVAGVYTWHDVTQVYGSEFSESEDDWSARIAAFYTPLRFIERGFWYVAQPLGSPLTESQKRSFGLLPEIDTNTQ